MNKQWKDFVRAAQLRLETSDDPHYDDLLILKQDIICDGQLQKIACLSYWNDILWSRALTPEQKIESMAAQFINEKQLGEI